MAEISKILYLVTQSEWGGAQRYIFDIASHLTNNQYEIAVAAGDENKSRTFLRGIKLRRKVRDKEGNNLFIKLDEKKIKSYKLKNLVREINPIKDLLAYFEIKKIIKEFQPDILHLNSSKAGFIGAVAGKKLRIKKIIYTVHGFVFNEPLPAWKRLFYLIAEKLSAKYKDKLICVSEYDRQSGIQKKIATENKFITITNGIDQLNLMDSKIAKIKLKLPENKVIIGTIANFYQTKGLIYFIQAARIVIDRFPEIVFTIIGDGDLKNQLESEIEKLKLTKNFILTGKINQAHNKLSAFDIYVCSSVKEGFPYSLLEAMQAGLPIVSAEVGGIPEMINNKKNGLLVKPADPAELAQTIIYLLENKKMADQLANQAKKDVYEKFSLEKMIAQTNKIYQG